MKILLAAGVFYPDVGGPAIHVRKIAKRLSSEGFRVRVVSYGDDPSNTKFNFSVTRVSRRLPKILQWLFYFFVLFWHAPTSKIIYAFDPTAAGMPACLVSVIFCKKFIIRIGGDPIWEREVEMGRRFMTIDKYYNDGLYKIDKPILFKGIKSMLSKTNIVLVVYNQYFKDFYSKYFGVSKEKIRIVKNPVFRRENGNETLSENPLVLFAGRFVNYKNLPLLIEAFDSVRKKINNLKLVLVGAGPDKTKLEEMVKNLNLIGIVEFTNSLPQEKLFELIKKSSICIAPALSEFNPNFILEALSFGKPVLLSKGNGLSVDLPEEFLFDPLNKNELEVKMESLLDAENYKKAVNVINGLPLNQTWENVTDFHLALVKEFIAK